MSVEIFHKNGNDSPVNPSINTLYNRLCDENAKLPVLLQIVLFMENKGLELRPCPTEHFEIHSPAAATQLHSHEVL